MHFTRVFAVMVLFQINNVVSRENVGRSITNDALRLIHDFSTCSEELNSLVNEATVLSIPMSDITQILQDLKYIAKKELQVYHNIKDTISKTFPNGQVNIDPLNQSGYGINYLNGLIDSVVPTDVPPMHHGICSKNAMARLYRFRNKFRNPGIMWRKGKWQKLRKKKPGQRVIRLITIDACQTLKEWDNICIISGVNILDDGVVVVADNENFLIRLFDLNGNPLKEFYLEPLLLGEITKLSRNTTSIVVDDKRLDDKDAKLLQNLEDGSNRLLDMSENIDHIEDKDINCTITDPRTYYDIRRYVRSEGVIFIASYDGSYERNTILQFDSNCSFVGVAARTQHNIESMTGVADLLAVSLNPGYGRRTRYHRNKIVIYHIPEM